MIELEQTEEKQLPTQIRMIRSFVKEVILKDEELQDRYKRNIEVVEHGS